jgi:transposase
MDVSRQNVADEVLYLRVAGLDLGKRFLLACVRTPNPARAGTWSLETERFGTTPGETRRLRDWLVERRVELVVMEATSDYWRPVYYTLQESLNLMLVNPAHLKGIRGRKSDPSDAAFLARAGASGMVMASFVPERAIRELRDLTRRRSELVVTRGQEAQRLEKELEDTGMKLTSVLSDVTGVSARRILNALIAGERDVHVLAELAVWAARKKIPALVEALDGTFTDHHAFMCRHLLDQIDHLDRLIAVLDERIATLAKDHAEILAEVIIVRPLVAVYQQHVRVVGRSDVDRGLQDRGDHCGSIAEAGTQLPARTGLHIGQRVSAGTRLPRLIHITAVFDCGDGNHTLLVVDLV